LLLQPAGGDVSPTRTSVESVLDRVRPFLIADGGNIELVAMDGDDVRLRLTGACAGCQNAQLTLQMGVEAALRQRHPDLRVVQVA
jgi:Fe-S cluster biogenesis protein NfuA